MIMAFSLSLSRCDYSWIKLESEFWHFKHFGILLPCLLLIWLTFGDSERFLWSAHYCRWRTKLLCCPPTDVFQWCHTAGWPVCGQQGIWAVNAHPDLNVRALVFFWTLWLTHFRNFLKFNGKLS